jgi:hypothetical protein
MFDNRVLIEQSGAAGASDEREAARLLDGAGDSAVPGAAAPVSGGGESRRGRVRTRERRPGRGRAGRRRRRRRRRRRNASKTSPRRARARGWSRRARGARLRRVRREQPQQARGARPAGRIQRGSPPAAVPPPLRPRGPGRQRPAKGGVGVGVVIVVVFVAAANVPVLSFLLRAKTTSTGSAHRRRGHASSELRVRSGRPRGRRAGPVLNLAEALEQGAHGRGRGGGPRRQRAVP